MHIPKGFKHGEGSFLIAREDKMHQEHAMGKKFCGGWCKRQLDAALKQEERVSVGKAENSVRSQEADKTAQCRGMSGFLSQHFTWQATHTTQEQSLISAQ